MGAREVIGETMSDEKKLPLSVPATGIAVPTSVLEVTVDVVALERLIPRHAYVGDLTLAENLSNYVKWLKAEVDHWKGAAKEYDDARNAALNELYRAQVTLTNDAALAEWEKRGVVDAAVIAKLREARWKLEAAKEIQDAMKSPTQNCLDGRAEGGSGCGVCGLCCKEEREESERLRYELEEAQSTIELLTEENRSVRGERNWANARYEEACAEILRLQANDEVQKQTILALTEAKP